MLGKDLSELDPSLLLLTTLLYNKICEIDEYTEKHKTEEISLSRKQNKLSKK